MGPAGFQGIVVARVGYRSAARMFVVSEDDTYSGYGLEQLSQVFTVKEHRQLAASDVRDWLIAVGKVLQKRRLIEKANAWARFVTGDYGADTSSDFAAMGIAELQTAGMPLADAKVVYSCLDGRRVEDGDSVEHSGVTTASDSRSADATTSLSEIAASMSQGMATAAKSAMVQVATSSKLTQLPVLAGTQPTVRQVQEFGQDIAKHRRRVSKELANELKGVAANPWKYLGAGEVLEQRVQQIVGASQEQAAVDAELYDEIMESIDSGAAVDIGMTHHSGVYLYYELLLRAINRPAELVRPSMKYVCEDVQKCSWAGYLKEDLQRWLREVQEVRFRHDLGDYTSIMEGLSQLLADLVPTQLNTLAHWHSTKKKHADFDDVMRALIAKAEGDQKQAEFQRKGKGTSSFTGGKAGRG